VRLIVFYFITFPVAVGEPGRAGAAGLGGAST
jgi:hypothetical protein